MLLRINQFGTCARLTVAAMMPTLFLSVGCVPLATNKPPQANVASVPVQSGGATVTLDGSSSTDPDGDSLAFTWVQMSGVPVALSSASDAVVTFTAPNSGTALTFDLKVSDGRAESSAKVTVAVLPAESTVKVEEMLQRSVTEDPAVMGDFPKDWLIADAGADLPREVPGGDEILEFHEMFRNSRAPQIVQEELKAGATRRVELDVVGPSGLAGLVQWIGTISPLDVDISLDNARLVSGTTYQMGNDRGGSYLRTLTTAGGRAAVSVTNTSGTSVTIRIIFMSTAL